ncbi:MAG: agmatinase [Bacteroidota bacterium]
MSSNGQINILGLPYDQNGSYLRGPALAPDLIWQAFNSPSANTYNEQFEDLAASLTYHGYLGIDDFENDINAGVTQYLDKGQPLISLGGDHSVTYPTLLAYAKKYPQLSILHIDAHPDLYENFEDNHYSHASPFARIMENKLAQKLVQVGIRTATDHQHQQMQRYGVDYIFMNQFQEDQKMQLDGPVFISLDIDVLDPAFAPGVSHYEPGGMSTRQLINFLQHQSHLNIIGADLVEYNPTRDFNNATAMVAAKLLKELATLILKNNAYCSILD